MQRRRWAAMTLLAVGLALALASAWALGRARGRAEAPSALEAQYQRAFHAAVQDLQDAEALLAKARASTSPGQQILLLTRARAAADAARDHLSQLPAGTPLHGLQRVLAQTGDLAYTLATELAQGRAPSPREWDALARLHQATARVAQDLARVQLEAMEQGWRWTEVARRLRGTAAPAAGPAAARAAADPVGTLAALDRELQRLPAPVYDGPFSAHLLDRPPRQSPGPPVTEAFARRRAEALLGGRLALVDRSPVRGGPLPGWIFHFRRLEPGPPVSGGQPGDVVSAAVSRAGGRVLWWLSARPVGTPRRSTAEALSRARAYLAGLGWRAVVPAGWVREGGLLVASFAPVAPLGAVAAGRAGDRTPVVLYPELLRVQVALDDGGIRGLDVRPYWLHRHRRRLPPPALRPHQVRAAVSPDYRVRDVRLAVILLPSGEEALTYEVRADRGAEGFLLYLDARDGREEGVLRVVEEDGVRLTR